ncbi:MAG: hypothetical protein H7X92_14830 [Chitinophagales bacterium]|nr:hypothetical protein [Hyphomicrobiales bacterium]
MTAYDMTPKEFQRLAETWGGAIDRWPTSKQEAAMRLAATPKAAALLAEVRILDALLEDTHKVAPKRLRGASYAALKRIMGQEDRRMHRAPLFDNLGWFIPAASIASAAILGVCLALVVPVWQPAPQSILSLIVDSGSLAAGVVQR